VQPLRLKTLPIFFMAFRDLTRVQGTGIRRDAVQMESGSQGVVRTGQPEEPVGLDR
jgi:hypothetical protein